MSKNKVKIRFISVNGNKMVMDVYHSLLGTIYKALRDDNRVFDITIECSTITGIQGLSYQDYVKRYGGLVVPA